MNPARKLKALTLAALFLGPTPIFAASGQSCDRSPRSVVYEDSPVQIFISNDTQRAEVIFPEEHLEGIYVEAPDGLQFYKTPIRNKLAFYASEEIYTGLAYVDGASGRTYILQLVSRNGCADSQVSITGSPISVNAQPVTDRKGQPKGLMHYLFNGKVPAGYQAKHFARLDRQDRLVFRQGSVEFYLQSQLVGSRYVGTTYEVVNTGRTAFKIAIDQIDYSSPAVRKALGRVRQVAMLPTSAILGPSPEFVSEMYSDPSRGLLFIVSEKGK